MSLKRDGYMRMLLIFLFCQGLIRCGENLAMYKVSDSEMLLEFSGGVLPELNQNDLSPLRDTLNTIENKTENLIQFPVNSDTEKVSANFTGNCRMPLVMAKYTTFPSFDRADGRLKITADFFGFNAFNALKADDVIEFVDYKGESFVRSPNLTNQTISIDKFVDSPIMVSVLCLAYDNPLDPTFSFKLHLKSQEGVLKESIDIKELVDANKSVFHSKTFSVSPRTVHRISYLNLLERTSFMMSHFSNEFLQITLQYQDDDGQNVISVYTKDNKKLFNDIQQDNVEIEIANKTLGVFIDVEVSMKGNDVLILGLKRYVFWLILAFVLLIIVSLAAFGIYKCLKKNKSTWKRKSNKQKVEKINKHTYLQFQTNENKVSPESESKSSGKEKFFLYVGGDGKGTNETKKQKAIGTNKNLNNTAPTRPNQFDLKKEDKDDNGNKKDRNDKENK